ncbi:hypothetical protein GUITHDRAFT_166637 [Guillardia theta CCMP2712]|uniref:Porin domain-containing protein n=1 Tax=Guillardia theta (strain CCMP2712) TaxID=905079 RepID=L1I904_GUITC|nr:hypothetical protein GUITHDRAFT_166637 [Guillardia theta CCMP2712]EKX32746.1 hypothetical protein GUITHDRAFT_166637 [Guillardia theta CCMP2712]|eukprot:XP_005819726.1 hypothetical protein GUITHDRAFT_166637 [Guillardia theta CCMP2712]
MRRSILLLCAAAACSASQLRLRGGAPPVWKDLVKAPAVLDSGYSTDNKLEITSKSGLNGGIGLKTTFLRNAADKISSTFKATTSYQGVDIEANLDGSGTIKGEAKADVSGVKLTLGGSLKGGSSIKDMPAPSVAAEYSKGDLTCNARVEGKNLEAGAVFQAGDVQVGGFATYDSSAGTLGDPTIAATYNGGNFKASAVVNGLKGDDVQATYTQSINSDLDVAGTFSTNGNKFALGASYKVDAGSSVKGKINSDGILNLGYKREVDKGSVLNAGFQVDTNNVDDRHFGISLAMST